MSKFIQRQVDAQRHIKCISQAILILTAVTAASTEMSGSAAAAQGSLRTARVSAASTKQATAPRMDTYGGSFYSSEQRRSILNGASHAAGAGISPNSSVGQLYSNGAVTTPVTNPGITSIGGARMGGANPIGGPARISPNGIGAPANGKPNNFITPYGNGANGPIGTYGGTSFGSAGGGAVR
ncbi:MAG TPA: hypothetical protein V6C81_30375 [Planktothrix sp.]|jgi:hypothetical protein